MVGARPGGGAVAMTTIETGTLGGFPNPPAMVRGEQSSPAPPAIGAAIPLRAGVLAATRLLVWTLLWGTVLRNIGTSVGVWAGGSLGAVASLLIGVVIPA